jgi:crotonobetaine/carnitine-CoA ligase
VERAFRAEALGVIEGDVLLTTLPLFHINALNTFGQALLTGATYVLEARFSASGFWNAAIKHKATVAYLLGAMAPILMARDPDPAEREHSIRIALGPGVPPAMHEPFKARTGISLLEAYGSTETNFVIGARPERIRNWEPWDGCATDSRRGVVDADDNEVEDGQLGELMLRANEPFAFATGYYGMPEKTVEAWRNLWFHTGDRVVRDAEGPFQVHRPPERSHPAAR